MEIKDKLDKPFTKEQRLEFIVTNNHTLGYAIEETETELQALGYTEEEIALQERERIAKLYLTGADVERGIYQAKGMDFDDILAFVMANPPQGLDVKALRIELKANHFYRGNPYVSAIGGLLGFTIGQLDKFFETNDHIYLTTKTLTINAIPAGAIVKINGIEKNNVAIPYGEIVEYEVSCEGYVTQTLSVLMDDDKTLDVMLQAIEVEE